MLVIIRKQFVKSFLVMFIFLGNGQLFRRKVMAIKKIYELKALIILALLASLLIVSMPQIANAKIWPFFQ